jgi:hypothetical protein
LKDRTQKNADALNGAGPVDCFQVAVVQRDRLNVIEEPLQRLSLHAWTPPIPELMLNQLAFSS